MTTYPEIPVSSGDMALILGGYKTLHFARSPGDAPFQPGETVEFVCHLKNHGVSSFRLPVVITEAKPEQSNSPLNPLDRWRAGRIIESGQKRLPSPEVGEQRWHRIKNKISTKIAKQFLAGFEEKPPSEIYASDIAGNASAHPVQRLSFTLKLMPDTGYPITELCQRFKTAYTVLAPRVTDAHRYQYTNHGHDGVFMAPPETPDLWAIRYLNAHQARNLEEILGRLYEPYERLSQLHKVTNEYRAVYRPIPDPDGINKALSGLPSIPCSLDTGSVAVMGRLKRIATRTPLPASSAERPSLTAVLYATGRGSAISSHLQDFQVPVEVDTRPESTRLINTGKLTLVIAQEHGFASPKDMRKGLGLKPGEECDIVSYPVALASARALPLDDTRAGKHRVRLEQAARAVLHEHGSANRFINTLPQMERIEAQASITHPRDYTPEMRASLEIPQNAKGTRQLPNDVLAARRMTTQPPSTSRGHEKRVKVVKIKRMITLHGGFDGLQHAVQKAEKRDAPPPKRLKPQRPSEENPNETTLSPIFTTPDETLAAHDLKRHGNREGLDKDGVPKATAPVVPAHKAPENAGNREEHIARAREAKKPRDKKPLRGNTVNDGYLSRRERIRHERRETVKTVRALRSNPDPAELDAAPQHESWQDFLLEEAPNHTRSK